MSIPECILKKVARILPAAIKNRTINFTPSKKNLFCYCFFSGWVRGNAAEPQATIPPSPATHGTDSRTTTAARKAPPTTRAPEYAFTAAAAEIAGVE
jgi:hypothetical protein